MNAAQVKQVLTAAAKLTPAKGRALVAAVIQAKADPDPAPDPLDDAQDLLELAMLNAALDALARTDA